MTIGVPCVSTPYGVNERCHLDHDLEMTKRAIVESAPDQIKSQVTCQSTPVREYTIQDEPCALTMNIVQTPLPEHTLYYSVCTYSLAGISTTLHNTTHQHPRMHTPYIHNKKSKPQAKRANASRLNKKAGKACLVDASHPHSS